MLFASTNENHKFTFVKSMDERNKRGDMDKMTSVSFQPLMKPMRMPIKKVEKY